MENQATTVGEFYEGDTLLGILSLEDSIDMFDGYDVPAGGEFAYPKLDGILFPMVVANAEVVAPCRWMGGSEVSLTVALNNYYQAMTEENADEVIADVYDFLSNQVELVEAVEIPDVKKEKVESPPQMTHSLESVNYEKAADNVPSPSRAQRSNHSLRREDDVRQSAYQKHSAPKNKGDDLVNDLAQPISEAINGSAVRENSGTVKAIQEDTSPIDEAATVHSVKVKTNDKAHEPMMQEVDAATVITAPTPLPLVEQDREQQTHKEKVTQSVLERDIRNIDEEPPFVIDEAASKDVEAEKEADDMAAVVSLGLEPDEPSGDSWDLPIVSDQEDDGMAETLTSYSYDGDFEESAGLLRDEVTEEAHWVNDSEEVDGYGDVQLQAIKKIQEVLNDITQHIDASKPEMHETKSMIESVIAELSLKLEGDKDSAAERSEIDIEKELQELLMKLLDEMSLTHESALLDALALLKLEQHQDGDTEEMTIEMMHAPTLYSRAKSLLFVISALIKRVSSRAIHVGRSVLRLYASNHSGDYQQIVSYS